ncbi:MAG: hypothetical protein H6620_12450 [Halobacteriovoraceae bacterium]|nr:hypothetical protein [Halobacteriovoraceae bacterium]
MDKIEINREEEQFDKKVISRRSKVSAEVDYDVADRVKNAVYWTPGLTMARFIEKALEDAIDKLEEDRGGKFEARERELVGGRPMN